MKEELLYNNGFGGFSKDGKEYKIHVSKDERTPLPWSHLLVNSKIGTLVTSNGGGFSWYGNSRENKISTWCNDVVLDTTSERILLQDNQRSWSAVPDIILENESFEVVYGFGYAKYILNSERYEQELTIFVTENPSQKISILKLKNKNSKPKKVNLSYSIDAVLGVSKEYTSKHLAYEMEEKYLKIFNRYSNDYSEYAAYLGILTFGQEEIKMMECSEYKNINEAEIKNNKTILNGTKIKNDKKKILNCKRGISTEILLEEEEEREIVFILDYRKDAQKEKLDENKQAIKNELKKEEENNQISKIKFENLGYYKQALEAIKKEWREKLQRVQVTTPIDSMNIILNGWILYQAISSRILGRASFYQSGGAYGFRDQLQDMLAILYVDTAMVKKQIIYHAMHQFKEGDVLHWWHPEKSNGIRTRFSDDLLWLVYVTCEYVAFTNDFEFLFQKIPFIEGRLLKDEEDEIYIETTPSKEEAPLLEHCMRAIEKSLDFGEHGLPKMGSGDWNDGMNTVGGESVWLGFFLSDILKKFLIMIKDERLEKIINDKEKECRDKNFNNLIKEENYKNNFSDSIEKEQYKNSFSDLIEKVKEIKIRYEEKLIELKKNLDKAWDGRWFKRAYFKNGDALGSNQNDECKIDNISQSWSVISGMAKKEKQLMAMESVENHLVDHENMLIKLLTPAFCNTKMEPGYIKSYIPGVRENGGQYTHGAIWAIIANCMLEKNDLATEYFRMLNPIEHARNREDSMKYKSEPYVISADIYSHTNLVGRGGWTWYTGSASWYFIAGVKYILGLEKKREYLEINPHLPRDWKKCYIKYKIENTEYEIQIIKMNENIENKKIVYLDNELVEDGRIFINLDNRKHKIEVKM